MGEKYHHCSCYIFCEQSFSLHTTPCFSEAGFCHPTIEMSSSCCEESEVTEKGPDALTAWTEIVFGLFLAIVGPRAPMLLISPGSWETAWWISARGWAPSTVRSRPELLGSTVRMSFCASQLQAHSAHSRFYTEIKLKPAQPKSYYWIPIFFPSWKMRLSEIIY